jgi:hypothetical protein
MEEKKLPPCCQNKSAPEKIKTKGFWRGLVFGLIPHTFCILFVVFTLLGSVFGATVAKKFLMIPHFFLFLVILSLLFATLSAWLYLRSHRCCSTKGIQNNWKYLTILYGTTLFINIIFIYYIFPTVTVATTNMKNSNIAINQVANTMAIKVDIPCSGHGPLIVDEIKKVNGVTGINYEPLNTFTINYDPSLTNETAILSLEIFKTYKATKI